MKTVGLAGCGARKHLSGMYRAVDLYTGPLTVARIRYAQRNSDEVFILSALHGLVPTERQIGYYDHNLSRDKTPKERKAWSESVLIDLRLRFDDFNSVNFLILAGGFYTRYLLKEIPHYEAPLNRIKGIGAQINWCNTH